MSGAIRTLEGACDVMESLVSRLPAVVVAAHAGAVGGSWVGVGGRGIGGGGVGKNEITPKVAEEAFHEQDVSLGLWAAAGAGEGGGAGEAGGVGGEGLMFFSEDGEVKSDASGGVDEVPSWLQESDDEAVAVPAVAATPATGPRGAAWHEGHGFGLGTGSGFEPLVDFGGPSQVGGRGSTVDHVEAGVHGAPAASGRGGERREETVDRGCDPIPVPPSSAMEGECNYTLTLVKNGSGWAGGLPEAEREREESIKRFYRAKVEQLQRRLREAEGTWGGGRK